ncbi:MAG: hypothetical protein DIU79_02815 [Actinobacteria bacterium]|nr:MAG: hypothetical protein DIU79_02815 [Actinomycetota bacterium]
MNDFWEIIGSSPMRDDTDVQTALDRVAGRLSKVSTDGLVEFAGRLERCLYLLDRRDFAEIPVELPDGRAFSQTSDHFLYARCACVLSGAAEFDKVLQTGTGFERFVAPGLQGAEGLLYLAPEIYESRTGEEMMVRSEFSIEWMSNKDGWA